ncbi:MAG TPA: HD domain-containing phosphohydrolase [Usitatibacter sp.]|nr:HD domain-containing phosphohydrolase [Usitatibacter sp.]
MKAVELLGRLRTPLPVMEGEAVVDAALDTCRRLYGNARSRDALPLAQAALAQCTLAGDRQRTIRAATACGLLSADMADLVGAIEYHVQALRIAIADENRTEMSRTWGNIGHAIGISGNFAMAAICHRRSIALVDPQEGPVYSRYTGCGNLADACYQLGLVDEGISHGERALREMTPGFRDHDPYAAMLLRRNLVRLHLAAGNLAEAEKHVDAALALAETSPTARVRIAGDIIRATVELARGRADIALTRLDQVLARAREVPATLRDTLACVIRAEEAAGNAARALIRLEELSDHVYDLGVSRAREHIDLAGLRQEALACPDAQAEQAKARLVAQLAPRQPPESWKTLQRLSAGAVMRVDETGCHGRRVGALTKALALANGMDPLQALEIGMAAEVHDIGLLSIPEGILAKSGPLNTSEYAIVQRHVDAGADMLRDDTHPMVFMAREIAKYNHAHWDGSGYPERVGGRFIPLPARICAIADAYDAMVCGLGAEARTMVEALQELHLQSGRQFDPQLVSCFDALIRSESEGVGVDLHNGSGAEAFHELVLSLKEDRGFV